MRFSDWSSDVCSSDIFPGRDRTEKIVDLPFGNILLPALDHARGAVLHEDRIPEMGVVDELLPVRGRHRDHETFDVSHGEVPSSVERSEEHTSELQSLMRISYAVFCLKKKKKT